MDGARATKLIYELMETGPAGYGWEDDAECRVEDPELLFPISEGPNFQAQANEAKSCCAACPVRVECLRTAMRRHEAHGIFGGLTKTERDSLARLMNRRGQMGAALRTDLAA